MIYAISDIHGHYKEFKEQLDILEDRGFYTNDDKLILLGDYIDRGNDSYKVLQEVYDLQRKYKDKVIALMGNHEEWFLNWLENKEQVWLEEDRNLSTSRGFLTDEQMDMLKKISLSKSAIESYDLIRECIRANHKDLLIWLKKLPRYYKTDTQIFVHAGVDEEAQDWWEYGTPDYVFTGKYPITTGKFYMDVISGHISASAMARNKHFQGIYFDGASHYVIDGGVSRTRRLLCLMYDDVEQKYYELLKDGTLKNISQN